MLVKMTVAGLALEPATGTPVVLLRDPSGEITVPIWIGQSEALAIASELEGVKPPRPMTHDLLRNVIQQMGFHVARIVVNDLKDNTFFAVVFLEKDGKEIEIDSRPSDAIALALRAGAPILVHRKVIDTLRREQEEPDEPQKPKMSFARAAAAAAAAKSQKSSTGPNPLQQSAEGASEDDLERMLRNMKPEDFGKYRQ
jgi:bifunctional DNase/RNase